MASAIGVYRTGLLLLLCCFPFRTFLAKGDPIPVSEEDVFEEKVCHPKVTFYDDSQLHYDRLISRYANCTHVIGNLVIADLYDVNIDYDLSPLETIRYVSGYLAIYGNRFPASISLPNLQIIRGNQTFSPRAVKGVDDITLLIAVTRHHHLFLPSLREVSSGNALIDMESCPDLCHLDSIDWTSILREGTARVTANNALCRSCSPECEQPGKGRHCWGPTAELCQQQKQECEGHCPRDLCVSGLPAVCCSSDCAVGCSGPSASQCMACRDYVMEDGRCSSFCPLYPSHVLSGLNCSAVPLS